MCLKQKYTLSSCLNTINKLYGFLQMFKPYKYTKDSSKYTR